MSDVFECDSLEELQKALEKGKAKYGDLVIEGNDEDGYSAREADTGILVAQYDTLEGMLEDAALVELHDGSMSNTVLCEMCESDSEIYRREELTQLEDGWYRIEDVVEDYQGELQYRGDCILADLRGYGERYIREAEVNDSWYYCEYCGYYVYEDEYNYDTDSCYACEEEENASGPIGDYHSKKKGKWYGKPNKKGEYVGMGFELEIDKNPNSNRSRGVFNQSFAKTLADKSGLDPDEVVFECDGSLNTGFEIISQPHTVAEFWEKAEQWGRMLDCCAAAGYKSHDAGTCGLHVHVSRRMLGRTEAEQKISAGKIFKFYTARWDDLVKASRRESFHYCDKNVVKVETKKRTLRPLALYDGVRKWGKNVQWAGSHGTALNNGREQTFEFRLGRGTLNRASFFAWIDLCIAVAKNSRKGARTLDDNSEWLKGIRESTARYLYKRDAFREEVIKLFPCLTWERKNESDGDSN